MKMRSTNKGVTVKLNLWALDKYLEDFTPLKARLWIRGQMTNAETGESKMFNDPGEMLSILGKWNTEKFKQLKKTKRIKSI